MPSLRTGWTLLRWTGVQNRPVRIFCGDRFTAERVLKRIKSEPEDGYVELLDSRSIVKDSYGNNLLRPSRNKTCAATIIEV